MEAGFSQDCRSSLWRGVGGAVVPTPRHEVCTHFPSGAQEAGWSPNQPLLIPWCFSPCSSPGALCPSIRLDKASPSHQLSLEAQLQGASISFKDSDLYLFGARK